MKKVLLLFSAVCLLFACNSNQSNSSYEKTEDEIIFDETNYPNNYIEMFGSFKVKINNKVECTVDLTSEATKVTYKEIVIELTFLDKYENELGSEIFYFDSSLPSGKRKSQTFKTQNKYKNTADFTATIKSAKTL